MNAFADPVALRDLFDRHTPRLMVRATYLGIPAGERREVVTSLLDDVALSLIEREIVPPDMNAYLNVALRNRARNDRRNRAARHATRERGYVHLASDERVIAEAFSQFGLSVAYPVDDPSERVSRPEISRLATWLAANLSEADVALLDGEAVAPSPGAARVRLHRLRARARAMLARYVATLNGHEHIEVERFLRRAQILFPDTPAPAAKQKQKQKQKQASRPRPRGAGSVLSKNAPWLEAIARMEADGWKTS